MQKFFSLYNTMTEEPQVKSGSSISQSQLSDQTESSNNETTSLTTGTTSSLGANSMQQSYSSFDIMNENRTPKTSRTDVCKKENKFFKYFDYVKEAADYHMHKNDVNNCTH